MLHTYCLKSLLEHVPWLRSKVLSKSTETLPAKIQRTVYWKRQLRLQLCHIHWFQKWYSFRPVMKN